MTTVTESAGCLVVPIESAFLDALRARGGDEFGNIVRPFAATGDEPLRCCLRRAEAGEPIALISYCPHRRPSPWAEVGPVFVHAERCAGPARRDVVPDGLRGGGRVLRAYRRDGSMNYDANVLLGDDVEIGPALREVLARPDVHEVHVRTAVPQCFLYAVRRGELQSRT